MKRPHLSIVGGVLFLVILVARFSGYIGWGIESGTSLSPASLLNVHSSSRHWLRVAGKRYENVTGTTPFHLKIDEPSAVFFVTDDYRDDKFAHFVFLQDGREISIKVDLRFDSYNLGANEASGRWVRIDGAQWPKIFVTCFHHGESTKHEFDLAAKSWAVIEKKKAPN